MKNSACPNNLIYEAAYDRNIPLLENELSLMWLGTAGFKLEYKGATLLIDPYFSRVPIMSLFVPLIPDKPLIDTIFNEHIKKCNFIVVGHSHFDHVMDVPYLTQITGCKVIGSESTQNLLKAAGISDKHLFPAMPGVQHTVGPFTIRLVKSRHSNTFFGKVPFPGQIKKDVHFPLRFSDYKSGEVFGIHILAGNFHLYHLGSCNLIEEEVSGLSTDLLLMGISGRQATPNFVQRTISALAPKAIIPHHYDNFFRSFKKGMRILPGLKFDKLIKEIQHTNASINITTLNFFQEMRIRTNV